MGADEPPDDDTKPGKGSWKPTKAWQWAQSPRHFVKASACGNARRHHPVTTNWDEVNCPQCLAQAPFRRVKKG